MAQFTKDSIAATLSTVKGIKEVAHNEKQDSFQVHLTLKGTNPEQQLDALHGAKQALKAAGYNISIQFSYPDPKDRNRFIPYPAIWVNREDRTRAGASTGQVSALEEKLRVMESLTEKLLARVAQLDPEVAKSEEFQAFQTAQQDSSTGDGVVVEGEGAGPLVDEQGNNIPF